MKKGDKVRRKEQKPADNFSAWQHLSVNTDYEIEQVLDSGLLVLKNFLILVSEKEIDLI